MNRNFNNAMRIVNQRLKRYEIKHRIEEHYPKHKTNEQTSSQPSKGQSQSSR